MSWLPSVKSIGTPVTLHLGSGTGSSGGRIARSSGTRGVSPEEIDDHSYERQARLPLEPWVALTSLEEGELVTGAEPGDIGRSVHVMKAPGGLLECVSRLSSQRFSRHAAPSDASGSEDHRDCAAEISKFCEVTGNLQFVGVLIDRPGRETVTLSERTGRLPGLHVDSWDDADVGCRHLSRNRISINSGRTPRYFLFVPLALSDVATYAEEASGEAVKRRGDPTPMARRFMSQRPEIPVLRCRIDPGELYIAPTENIIHDGSSTGTSELGRSFVVLGRMAPR
jgi:hypothetical protein